MFFFRLAQTNVLHADVTFPLYADRDTSDSESESDEDEENEEPNTTKPNKRIRLDDMEPVVQP